MCEFFCILWTWFDSSAHVSDLNEKLWRLHGATTQSLTNCNAHETSQKKSTEDNCAKSAAQLNWAVENFYWLSPQRNQITITIQ